MTQMIIIYCSCLRSKFFPVKKDAEAQIAGWHPCASLPDVIIIAVSDTTVSFQIALLASRAYQIIAPVFPYNWTVQLTE